MSSPQAAGAAGGSPQHTLTQADTPHAGPGDLTDWQLKLLFTPVHGNRVRNLRGMAHMEAWDIRRELIRVFGFGGFNIQTLALDLVAERETKQGDRSRWTVVYRAQVRLTVKDAGGRVLAEYEDGAAGDSQNQPSLGDAHDMAMKTALSQAMKRCAVNLGDQFGLSLYNNGSRDAVVGWSAAHPPAAAASAPAIPERPEDPPVQPEPQPVAAVPEAPAPVVQDTPSEPVAQQDRPKVSAEDIREQTKRCWANAVALGQVLSLAQREQLAGEVMPGDPAARAIGKVLRERITALQQGQASPTVTAEQAGAVPAQRERGAA